MRGCGPRGATGGRARATALLVLALVATLVPTLGSRDERAEASPLVLGLSSGVNGPLGAVSVVGDSVLMGAGLFSPTIVDRLVAQGYGPIRYQAAAGMSTGKFNVPTGARASWWIQHWRSQGWDAPTVIVNVGANDQGLCNGNYQCAYDSVVHMVDTIGANRQIWWPLATAEPRYAHRVGVWNSALNAVAAQRPNLHVWNWPAVMAGGGFPSHDNIHLSPDGYRKRSVLMAAEVVNATAKASRTGGDAPLPTPTAAATRYRALTPTRIIDTRQDPPGRRPSRTTVRVDFGSAIPPDAKAVAVSVTAAEPSKDGYLRAFPCGGASAASTVNYTRNVSRGAMTIAPLGDGADICVYAHGETDVIVDLQGVFLPPTSSLATAGFSPLPAPQRLHDTRNTGRAGTITIAAPAGATAVAVNLTAVNGGRAGWLRAFPCGSSTGVSNVNYRAGEAVAGAAFVPVSAAGTFCVTSNKPVDMVVDLTGVFRASGGLSFRPVSPTRMLDTRDGKGGWSPIMGSGQAIDFRVAPSAAKAVTGTVATINPRRDGYVTGYGCGNRPPTSTVNGSPPFVLANSLTTGISATGRLCLFSQRTTQLIFDTTGWWVA